MFDTNNSGFSFGSLNLSGVQAAAGVSVLPPGRYICKSKDAELKSTKDNKGKLVQVRFVDEGGKGVITNRFNVFNPSAEATRIGLEQIKGFCVFGGHPDPDNLGQHGIASLNNLRVGVVVGTSTYNGETRSEVKGFFNPDEKATAAAASAPAPAIGQDSDIPF